MSICTNMISGKARLDTNDIQLPFYIHSVGIDILQTNDIINTQGLFCDFVEFGWCTEGTGIMKVYDRVYRVEKNDTMFYLPGEDHYIQATSDNFMRYFICLTGTLAPTIMLSYHYDRVQHASEECPVELFEKIRNEIKLNNPVAIGELCGLVLMILARANSYKSKILHENRKISDIMKIIRNSLGSPALCVDYVATKIGMPKPTLRLFFERETGRNLGEYIRNERFQKALVLIRTTEMPITEIAESVGYTEMPSFCRLIKRGTGLSPIEYRNQ